MTEREASQIQLAELAAFWRGPGLLLLLLIALLALLALAFRRRLSAGLDQLLAALGLLEPEES